MAAPGHDRRRALRLGHWAEIAAAALLLAKGYRLLAWRYAANGGEIDLIALRGDVVAFVEVKARRDVETGLSSIGPEKQRRIGRAVRHWIVRNPWCLERTLRADAVVIHRGWPRHVPDAFLLPGAEDGPRPRRA